ncbi:MAG: hypothetical protein JWN34_4038 [Bryobacterales bacterium]|nr:hypothetical protein [Bryobacterales bacterium]
MRLSMIMAFVLVPTIAIAQTRPKQGDPKPLSGTVYQNLEFPRIPVSIEDLVRQSSAIIDARVTAVLPSARANLNDPYSIQTDAIVVVTQVLAGTVPAGPLAISQFGGTIGELKVVFEDEPQMMSVGDRYVFFLNRPSGSRLKTETGYPRFFLVAGWIGKAKVADGKMSFPVNARGSGLTGQNGTDVNSFFESVIRVVTTHRASARE